MYDRSLWSARQIDAQALEDALRPKLSFMGEEAVLDGFKSFFLDRKLQSGAQVLLLWRTEAKTLEVAVRAPGETDYKQVWCLLCLLASDIVGDMATARLLS